MSPCPAHWDILHPLFDPDYVEVGMEIELGKVGGTVAEITKI